MPYSTKETETTFEKIFEKFVGENYDGSQEQKARAIAKLREEKRQKTIEVKEIEELITFLDPDSNEALANRLTDREHWRQFRRAALRD